MALDPDERRLELIHPTPPPERRQVAPSQIIGTGVFILTELMFFAGLISAFSISKAGAAGGIWPPPGQPRLPAEATLINTVALLASGALLLYAGRLFKDQPARARWPYLASVLLGVFFVAFQGFEWVSLLSQGLTMTSSTYGSFFYVIVGAHGLHALGGLLVLGYVYRLYLADSLSKHTLTAMQMYWSFVVILWPILYVLVYL